MIGNAIQNIFSWQITTGRTHKNGKAYLEGNLTLKEVTKNVEFLIMFTVKGNSLNLTSENFTIDRTKWGINFMSKTVLEGLGDKYVSDHIELKLNIKATKA